MLSSPPPPMPPPHRNRLADEHDETQYSLDLDALTLDDEPSGLDSPSVHQVVDNIRSDDIDGPTDFTVNLAKYFQGTPRKRPLPAWRKEQDMFDDESADLLSTASPDASPRVENNSKFNLDKARKSILQPTVEDYWSELTPAKVPSVHLTPNPVPRRSHSTSRLRESQNQRPTSPPTISSLRSPMPHFTSSPEQKSQALQQELRKLRETNESLQNQLDSERASREYQQSERPTSRDESLHGSELESLRNELHRLQGQTQDYQYQVKELQGDLDKAKAAEKEAVHLADERAKELDQIHDTEDAEIHNLHVQLGQARDAERQTHNTLDKVKEEMRSKDSQLSDLRSQLKQSQDNLRETEHDLADLKKWNDGQRKAKDDELQRMQQDLADARQQAQKSQEDHEEDLAVNRSKVDLQNEPSQREQDLERQVSDLQTKLEVMREEAKTTTNQLDQLRTQLEDAEANTDLQDQLNQARSELAAKDLAIQQARESADTKAVEMTRALAHQLQQAKQQLSAQSPTTPQSSNTNTLLQQLESQLQKAKDDLITATQQHESDKEAWAKADSEAQSSQASVYDQLSKEIELRKKAEEELRAVREELDILQNLRRMDERPEHPLPDSLRKELQALTAQLTSLQQSHHQEVEKLHSAILLSRSQAETPALTALKAEHTRAITLIEEGMLNLRTSRDSLCLEIKTLESTLSTTKAELETCQSSLLASESRLETTNQELEISRTQLQTSDSTIKDLRIQLVDSQAQLQDLQALNQEFDARLTESLKKREDVWRARCRELKSIIKELEGEVGRLKEEREVMAKALMGFWGREEFGDDVGGVGIGGMRKKDGMDKVVDGEDKTQRFRYQFARS